MRRSKIIGLVGYVAIVVLLPISISNLMAASTDSGSAPEADSASSSTVPDRTMRSSEDDGPPIGTGEWKGKPGEDTPSTRGQLAGHGPDGKISDGGPGGPEGQLTYGGTGGPNGKVTRGGPTGPNGAVTPGGLAGPNGVVTEGGPTGPSGEVTPGGTGGPSGHVTQGGPAGPAESSGFSVPPRRQPPPET